MSKKDKIGINPKELKKEDKKLGEGSFGIVYLGTFRGNKVAIKEMIQVRDTDDSFIEFQKEVTMLDKFRSEYIIHFYGAVFIPNKICIVTEFAQFGSLQDLMDTRKEDSIPMNLRIKMMIDSAKGIQYLHSKNILHRDIKPGNILIVSLDVNEKVNAKLTDFGSSRNVNQMMTNSSLTVNIGSPAFMAPEILNGEKYNWQVDIYSFAITMFECFGWCKCYPTNEFTPWKIAPFVTEGKRRPKHDNMTNEQYQLIEQCWKQNPKERIKIKEAVEGLEKIKELETLKRLFQNEVISQTSSINNLDIDEMIQIELKVVEELRGISDATTKMKEMIFIKYNQLPDKLIIQFTDLIANQIHSTFSDLFALNHPQLPSNLLVRFGSLQISTLMVGISNVLTVYFPETEEEIIELERPNIIEAIIIKTMKKLRNDIPLYTSPHESGLSLKEFQQYHLDLMVFSNTITDILKISNSKIESSFKQINLRLESCCSEGALTATNEIALIKEAMLKIVIVGDSLKKRKQGELKKETLKRLLEEVKKRTNNTIDLNEMKQIEKWSEMKIGNIIFDSNVDNWSIDISVFDEKIINKSNLIFLIEDKNDNKFGGYVNAKIDKYDKYIKDSKSFLFSLKSNGRLNGMKKFDIEDSQKTFYLNNQSDNDLFAIGFYDICIFKENNKNKSFCKQRSYNYNEIKNALCGKLNFTPKRITVIQLIDPEEIRKQEERKEIEKKISVEDEMKQIEEWSGMKVGNIIFDSNVDNWKANTSVFDQKIINKSNLIFLIEDEHGNKFGGYVNAKIDKYGYDWISDPKSFVFSLKSNGRLNGMFKFDIKQSQYAFCMYKQSNYGLFGIGGGHDIFIRKEDYKNKSLCKQYSFNYNGIENALCGKLNFTPKRITVIQLIYSQKQVIVPISKPLINNLDNDEMKQIEEWTQMKKGNIIFDSNVNNWNVNTSVFDQKVINKSNLIFLIEDDDNKFGGYVNAIIDKYGWINDSKSFVFSLKSNGRLNGMLKFDIKQSQYVFYLWDRSYDRLFGIGYGNDICIYKENNKNESLCYQESFNYNGIQNALCGKSYPNNFTPKRITVIQLI